MKPVMDNLATESYVYLHNLSFSCHSRARTVEMAEIKRQKIVVTFRHEQVLGKKFVIIRYFKFISLVFYKM